MKNLFKLAVVALVAISMNACKNAETADKVAEKFLTSIEKKDFAAAKALATPESQAIFDMKFSKDNAKGGKEGVIAGIKCKETDTTATCDYTKDGDPNTLNLSKRGGKWMVDVKKETPSLSNPANLTDSSATMKGDTTKMK